MAKTEDNLFDTIIRLWFEARERPIAISIFRQQTWQELFFALNRDF